MKTITNVMVAICTAVTLTACALLQPMNVDDEARRVAKITLVAYETTQQAMLIYGRLPTCNENAGIIQLCKSAEVWQKIRAADRVATTAIVEATPVLNGSAVDAGQLVKALVAISNVKNVLKEAQTHFRSTSQ